MTITTKERLGSARVYVVAPSPGEAIRRVVRAAAWITPGWRAEVQINESSRLDTAAAHCGPWTAVALRAVSSL